jgi:nucleoside-diphosphate-sugar epimerase
MDKVLITGANGFIGSHIAKMFYSNGYNVVGWDLKQGQIDNIHVEKVDLLDMDEIQKSLNSEKPEIIVHCAGNADVGKSVKDPCADFEGNVTVTHNLLFSLHQLGMDSTRVVFLSSAAVYGNPKKLPIMENDELNPLSPYALHKQMCEDTCKYFVLNYNMDIKIVRIFSAYGARLKKQILWDMFIKAQNTRKLSMFGTGNETRDYINVSDVIQAIFLVATKAPEDENVYNLANGKEITIRTITEMFAKYYGIQQSNIVFTGNAREGDPINWRADISKLKALGYKQSIDIGQGIKDYVEWVVSL